MPGKVTEIFFKEGCSEDFLISAKQNIPESEYIKKAVTKFVTAFFVPLRKMKHHLTILHAGITHFKHFMYKQQEESKLKK